EAALLSTRRGGAEARQFEEHPCTGIQLLHVEVQAWPFGRHLVLAARADVGFSFGGELVAVTAQYDRQPGRCTASDAATARRNLINRGGCRHRLTSGRSCGSGTRSAATAKTTKPDDSTPANVHAADIPRAHRGVPVRL